jgi:PKHD-type hydroxylase
VSSSNPYDPTLCYRIPTLFSRDECGEIIKIGEVGSGTDWWLGTNDPTKRRAWSSVIAQSSETEWIFKRLRRGFESTADYYQFDLDDVSPELIFARYGVDDHLDWHIDLGEGEAAKRKLAISVLLSDRSEYAGGELQFSFNFDAKSNERLGYGIVFPPYLPHRVKPVKRGTRYALIGWMCGPPFK